LPAAFAWASVKKRLKVLERTRRECVAEMILEPIKNFRSEDYAIETAVKSGEDVVKQAIGLETVAEKYYKIAGEKVSVPEVARVLKKIAAQHADQRETLGELEH
jgi:translation initiation factor 2 alpha subunit (eIF-2alpha)